MNNNRILTAIPCLYNGDTCLKAFKSVIDESDLLILNNGGDASVKQAIDIFKNELHGHAVLVFENETNQYVTSAWNIFLKYFIDTEFYDQLVILNSDLILQIGWSNYLVDGQSVIPSNDEIEDKEVFSGTPGIMITMNREMAKIVYPIPSQIRIWHNDEWIYTKLRKCGYKTIVKAGLKAVHHHGGSQTCQKLPEFQEIIEQDKIEWGKIKLLI